MDVKPTSQIKDKYTFKNTYGNLQNFYLFSVHYFLCSKPFTWKLVSWPEVSTRPEFLLPAKSITVALRRRVYDEMTDRFHIVLRYSCAAILTSLTSNIPPKPSLPLPYKFRHKTAFKTNHSTKHKIWAQGSTSKSFLCCTLRESTFHYQTLILYLTEGQRVRILKTSEPYIFGFSLQ